MGGRIPQSFIDELLSRIDIVDVIEAHVPLRKAGRDYTARCPFHDEKNPSFSVSPAKQFYHCFGCGAHGTAIGFLMEYERLDFVEAVRELAARAGMEVPIEERTDAGASSQHDAIYATLKEACEYYRAQLRKYPEAVSYLKRRGLTGEIAAEFAIGYAPPGWDGLLNALGRPPNDPQRLAAAGLVIEREGGGHYDRFRDRIMFPIRDRRGRVIGFGGRVIGEETPKYLNSPEIAVFQKGRELYGIHEAHKALRQIERLLVVEGYMDVVALAQHGIRYAVATLGTATTREHMEKLFRAAPEVVFCFDGDRAGRDAAWRAVENTLPALREGRQARFMFLPENEDPDTLIRKEGRQIFENRIAQSIPFSTFFFESLRRRADISSVDGRARLVELARPLLSKLPPGVFRDMMVSQLAELTRLEAGKTARLVGGPAPHPLETPRKAKPATRGKHTPPAPLQTAIALLLQAPSLARLAGEPRRFMALPMADAPLFCELLELFQRQPHLTAGAILERWRNTEAGTRLAALAGLSHPVPPEGAESEFADTIKWLDNRRDEQRMEFLLEKSRETGLSMDEKSELKRLLAGNSPPVKRP